MKKLLTLILAAALASCSTTSTQDPSVLVSAGVTYYAAKAVQKHPEKAQALRDAADALDVLSGGVVNKETVLALLTEKLGKNDPELNLLVGVAVSYFAPGDLALPESAKYPALAKKVASAIRAALPPA